MFYCVLTRECRYSFSRRVLITELCALIISLGTTLHVVNYLPRQIENEIKYSRDPASFHLTLRKK